MKSCQLNKYRNWGDRIVGKFTEVENSVMVRGSKERDAEGRKGRIKKTNFNNHIIITIS